MSAGRFCLTTCSWASGGCCFVAVDTFEYPYLISIATWHMQADKMITFIMNEQAQTYVSSLVGNCQIVWRCEAQNRWTQNTEEMRA